MGRTPASKNETVVVGMSGGVDSSVAAALLLERGYRVVGLFMKSWDGDDEDGGECPAAKDFRDVVRVCDRLGIPYYSIELVREYRESVFAEFVRDFEAGLTPNPDVLCNREIKFSAFLGRARELGADWVATGHYARVGEGGRLLKAVDPAKDQSYFLHAVESEAFRRVLFPVGELRKTEVRRIAASLGLATAEKRDSTGICFIGERDFPKFLSRYVKGRPGAFSRLDGTPVGGHRGVQLYTLGQRRGLGLGGEGERWFVVAKDVERNVVYVERGGEHPALYCDELEATRPHWISGEAPTLPLRCRAKVRYRQEDQGCWASSGSDGGLLVEFDRPQRAVTPGQYVVFYQGEICLGGARIRAAGESYYRRGKALERIESFPLRSSSC